MARFVRDIFGFVGLQTLLIGVFLWFFHDPLANFPMYKATRTKHNWLDDAASPRMVLVGDSNLLYGIESERIRRRTDYTPVNMGLVGGLRLAYILDEVEPDLRSGDLVVLSAGDHMFNARPVADATPQALIRVLVNRPENALYLSWGHWRVVLDEVHVELGLYVRRAWTTMLHGRTRIEPPEINYHGDLVKFRKRRARPRDRAPQLTELKRVKRRIVRQNVELINAFADRCGRRGIRVVYSYPPSPGGQPRAMRQSMRQVDQVLRRLTVPVIHDRSEMHFAEEDFVEQTGHLWGSAIRRRTDILIDAVARHENAMVAGAGTD